MVKEGEECRRANTGFLYRSQHSPRDYESVTRIDHKSNKTVTKGMDLSTLFSDAGACMLMPAVDQGPLCEFMFGCGRGN